MGLALPEIGHHVSRIAGGRRAGTVRRRAPAEFCQQCVTANSRSFVGLGGQISDQMILQFMGDVCLIARRQCQGLLKNLIAKSHGSLLSFLKWLILFSHKLERSSRVF